MKSRSSRRAAVVSLLLSLLATSFSSFESPAVAVVNRTVTYDLNGAPGETPATETLQVGQAYYVPTNPVWEDHFFLGWSDDSFESTWGGPVQMDDSFEMPNENIIMTAQWDSTVHPIVRSVYNNNSDGTQLWAYVGGSPHSGADIGLGWCVTSGPNADPKTWIVRNHTSDVESESLYIASPNQFTSGEWYEMSPDPSLSVSAGDTQVVSLGDPINDIMFENSGCEATNYDFNPSLPAGLDFNFETMTISGTPMEALETTTFELSTERWYSYDITEEPLEKIGWATITFDLTVQDEPQFSLTKKISSFKTKKSTLVASLKGKISTWVQSLPEDASITCQGAVRKNKATKSNKSLANKRALAVCKYAKQVRSDITYSIKAKPSLTKLKNFNYVILKFVE